MDDAWLTHLKKTHPVLKLLAAQNAPLIMAFLYQVFITPNRRSMVIFGLGYGIEMLKEVGWLQNKRIISWGDIDTHGFAILSQIRAYFPQVKSLCMDKATLMGHWIMWVKEPEDKRCMRDLPHLTGGEQALLKNLQSDQADFPVRLEQERISHTWLREMLNRYV